MRPLNIEQTFEMAGDWYPQAEALLDEHHVAAICGDEAARVRFGSHVAIQAEQQKHVEVVQVYGRFVRDVRELAHMLSRALPVDRPIDPTIERVTEALRTHLPETRRRYVIWHDADVTAAAAPEMFWRAADALMGVAAEAEYSTEDRLVIGRALFVGDERLLASPALSRCGRTRRVSRCGRWSAGCPGPRAGRCASHMGRRPPVNRWRRRGRSRRRDKSGRPPAAACARRGR